MSKFCKSCIHWEKIAERVSGDQFGICTDISVKMNVALDGKTMLSEDGTIWTAEYFGCVYWRQYDQSLINITDTIK